MKSLILTDIHYQQNNPVSRKKLKDIMSIKDNINAVILCGDNAELSENESNHFFLFEGLRKRFDCPIGFVLGNHELWGKNIGIHSEELLNKLFLDLADKYNLTYLENENLVVENMTFIGTYGHYDYSFLKKGKGVTIEDLLRGAFKINDKQIKWGDRFYMDWDGKTDKEVCEKLVKGFEQRISKIEGRKISISHMIPRQSLNGYGNSLRGEFLTPYGGSKMLGDVLEKHGGEYHFCGHTHAQASVKIGKTTAINLGSDYNILRYIISDSSKKYKTLRYYEIDYN